MQLPAGIFFVNADLNDGIKSTLTTQLFITDTITGEEFDARVVSDPNYVTNVHLNDLRILVIRQSFRDLTNRNLADVVMFVKQGLVSVEKNNFGPPSLTLPLSRINIYDLLRANNSPGVVILPPGIGCPPPKHKLFGIVADELADTSGVHDVNPDNEYNNPNWINRK